MGFPGWALLIALAVISCGYFKSTRSALWGVKGVATGIGLFIAFWWVLPVLWGLLKIVFWLAIVAMFALAAYAPFKVLAKKSA